MKSIIIFNLLAIITINPIVNAHEDHDHQIYNWSSSKNKTIKTESTFDGKKLEVIKNQTKSIIKQSWIKLFKR